MCFLTFNRKLRISAFSVGLSLLSCFSPLVGSVLADNIQTNETEISFSVSDLTPEEFDRVASLAPSLLAASSGNITNDVAAILDLLTKCKLTLGSANGFRTYPSATAGGPLLSVFLGRSLYDGTVTASSTPSVDKSFLYMIQRALYGSSGVPSGASAVVPTLSRVEDSVTNLSSALFLPSGYSYFDGNPGANVEETLVSLYLMLYPLIDALNDVAPPSVFADGLFDFLDPSASSGNTFSWQDIANMIYDSTEEFNDDPYDGWRFVVQEGGIADVWNSDGVNVSYYDSALRVADGYSHEQLNNMLEVLDDLNSKIPNYTIGDSVPGQNNGGYLSGAGTNFNPSASGVTSGDFDFSSVGEKMLSLASSMLTNRISSSVFAVDTNAISSITNLAASALPDTSAISSYAEDSLSFVDTFANTDPSLRIFSSFEVGSITIPGMSLDLSDTRLSSLQTRCNLFARVCWLVFFVTLTLIRVRSFLDYAAQGFTSMAAAESYVEPEDK